MTAPLRTPPASPTPSPASSAAPSPPRSLAFGVLAASVVGISFAAPLIRLSDAPALVIAAWRLGFSLLLVAVPLLVGGGWREWRRMSRGDFGLAIGAGVLLALHFWSWNQSLRYTSVAASVALVNLQPVIIAIVGAYWLREPASRRQWSGILLAVAGALVVGAADVPGGLAGFAGAMSGADGRAGSLALLGDLLAFVGAITAACYYLIGRRLRQSISLWPYVAVVYGAAFVTCVVLALVTGATLGGQPPKELLVFAGLAIGPMLLGHTGMNWALGHLPAFVVNLTTLGEPVGATLLAAVLPWIRETPGPLTLVGGVLVLAGVLLAARR